MSENIQSQVENLTEEIKKCLSPFQFKIEQIEGDIKTVEAQDGQHVQEFLAPMQAAATQYRDSIDTIQIAIQNLEWLAKNL